MPEVQESIAGVDMMPYFLNGADSCSDTFYRENYVRFCMKMEETEDLKCHSILTFITILISPLISDEKDYKLKTSPIRTVSGWNGRIMISKGSNMR